MYPTAYIEYLSYFHGNRDYFECHEVLEEHWKGDHPSERKNYWVALIQIAVSLYHHRRQNFSGALKMMNNAIKLLRQNQTQVTKLGIDYDLLMEELERYLDNIRNKGPYKSIDLPILDNSLLEECYHYCNRAGIKWGLPSNLDDQRLVHKHSLRDRSDVIAERLIQKQKRQNKTQD